jgi:hypothetical protein
MTISIANLNAILQNDYLPGFKSQLNEELSYFYKLMEKNTSPSMGANETFLVTFGRSGGIGSRTELGTLPTAAAASRLQINVVPKNLYARISLSDRLIKSSATGASFVNALDLEMKEMFRDAKDNLNRQMFGDGTGKLALCTAEEPVDETVIAVDNTRYFAEGMVIDTIDMTGATSAVGNEGHTIIAIDEANSTITVTPKLGEATTANDVICISGSYGLEITGLDAIMTPNNTIYGVDRANNTWFNPGAIDANGVALDDEIMEQAIQRVDLKSGKKPEVILSGYRAYRVLKNYLAQFQRYSEIETRYDAGHITMSYNGIPVEQDKYQGDTTMDFLNIADTFELLSIGELFDWMDMDGAILKPVADRAAYEAILTNYAEIMCKQPGANTRITNITL